MHSETMWTWNQVEIPEVIFEQEGGQALTSQIKMILVVGQIVDLLDRSPSNVV